MLSEETAGGPGDDRVPTRPTRPRPGAPVTLSGLVDALTAAGHAVRLHGDGDVEVTGATLSTQRVRPGDLYAALPGTRVHGARFAARAVADGAVAVLTDAAGVAEMGEVPAGPEASGPVPVLVVEGPRAVLGAVSALVYGDPASRLTVIGVTGTQGKTTTTRLLEGGLAAAGVGAAVVGTVGTRIGGRDVATSLTTPEAPDLHGLFAVMAERGIAACAMEVSSHALVLGRVDGVVFDLAVFTNLGHDHLDFHDSLDDYFAAKATLFTPQRCRRALVNVDDEHGRRLLEQVRVPASTFSAEGRDADWRAVDVELRADGSSFTVVGPDGTRTRAGVPLAGDFNVSNALAAIAACGEVSVDGADPAAVAAGIAAGRGVPGRLERVLADPAPAYEVIVDYAHKPDALRAILATLRPLAAGRLILVIGAGGDRDRGKRAVMGEIAAHQADLVVVTDDNPRTEDPAAIRAALLEGARRAGSGAAEVVEVDGRRAAIRAALAHARAGDIVLVAGKGHETGQEVDGVVHPFDDRDVVREELAGLGSAR